MMFNWKQEIQQQLKGLRLEATREAEIVEELAQHMESLYEELLADGLSPDEARSIILEDFRDNDLLAFELQSVERQPSTEVVIFGNNWRKNMFADLWQDLRYGARMLRKNYGFTLVAVVTLALGIGATTAIFTVVNAVLLRPLPFKEPDRLIMFNETKLPQFPEFSVSPANFLDWKQQNSFFERVVAIGPAPFNLTGTGDPERLRGMRVSEGFCAMLGVQPMIGRDFLPEEDQQGHNQVVILSHGLWQSRFGGDDSILDQPITLDGQSYTVIGVMPPTFYFIDRTNQFWTPMAFTAQQAQNRGGHSLAVIGQLKAEAGLDQASAEMVAIADRLAAQYPEVNQGWNVKLTPLLEYTVRSIKPALLALLGAVGFVLLIACVNVANLLLARAAGRQKEIALRTALGAGRWRIVRQLLTESVLLSLAGGVMGLLLAKWGLDALLKLVPQELPRMSDVSLDGRVLAFSAAITLVTGLVFGLIPALQASRVNLNEAIKDGGRGSTEGKRHHFIRNALVVMEVAAALVLLVGAGLMTKSFMRLQEVEIGFNPDKTLAVSLALPRAKYPEENQQVAFFQQLMENVRGLPGVQSVGATSLVPLSGDDFLLNFKIEGQPPLAPEAQQSTHYYSVSADYFKAMGIRLLRGRYFTEQDTRDSLLVAIINETMAKKIFPGEDPIGKRITFNMPSETPSWFEIVGIVGDVKHYSPQRATSMQTYEPYTQQTFAAMALVARTSGDPASLGAAIRGEVLQLDKEQPVSNINTLDHLVSTSVAQQRFSTLLFGIFAAVAMMLASIGIYGLLSYLVAQRTHEIGIRLALGAQTSDVLRMVVRQGFLLAGAGIALGIGVALLLAKLTTSFSELLYEVTATDPETFAVIAVALLCVALLACYLPARRATKVDPIIALRSEQ
jgi:putative ABC transport system permease protein